MAAGKTKAFAMMGLSLLAVGVTSISTFAWFQIKTSTTPSTSVATNGVRTDAFVYNKNSAHTNDDAANQGFVADEGGTVAYDHSKGGTVTDWYIVGDCYTDNTGATQTQEGTLANVDWDARKALQMYKNPSQTSDKAVYFNIHFTVGTMFKVASSNGTWLGYTDQTFDHGADMSDHFEAGTSGNNSDNIYCKTECTVDVYVNGSNQVAIVSRSEQQQEREVGSNVGFYIVGNNSSKTDGKADTGAFKGGDFDLAHSYPINFDSSTTADSNQVGAYYGLHLYENDYFKIWDGRDRSGQYGWYGWSNNGLLSNSSFFTGSAGSDITCVKEGYYDVFVYTRVVGGSGGGQYVSVTQHVENNPYTGTVKSARGIENGPTRKNSNSSIDVAYTDTVEEVAVYGDDTTHLYLSPGVWDSTGSPRYAAYFYGGGNDEWKDMTSSGSYYIVDIPSGQTSVIFCRMNPTRSGDNNGNNWNNNNKWNQSNDLTISGNEGKFYAISGWGSDKSPGDWGSDVQQVQTGTTTQTTRSHSDNRYYLVGNGSVGEDLSLTLTWSSGLVLSDTPGSGNKAKLATIYMSASAHFQVFRWNGTSEEWYHTLGDNSSSVNDHPAYSAFSTSGDHIVAPNTPIAFTLFLANDDKIYVTYASYTVTLNDNGATECDSLTSYVFGTGATLPTPTKTGSTFGGWYTNSSFTGTAVTSISSSDHGNKTYYAKWTVDNYTVTLNNQDATTRGATTVSTQYGSDMPSIATNKPAKTNFTFGGYFANTGGSGKQYYKANGTSNASWDKTSGGTLYAKWTRSITLNRQGGTTGSESVTVTYNSTTISAITMPTKPGYTFNGYWTGTNGSGTKFINADGTVAVAWGSAINTAANGTLYASWNSAGVYLLGNVMVDGNIVGKWDTNGSAANTISNSPTISGTTVSFTPISLTAGDQIKIYSKAQAAWLPASGDDYAGNTYCTQNGVRGGDVYIRYTGTYTISCTIDGSNNISDLVVTAITIATSNFILGDDTLVGTAATSVDSTSGNFVFTWTNVTFSVGQKFVVETITSNTVVQAAWGINTTNVTYNSSHFYQGTASAVNSGQNFFVSIFHQIGATVEFTLNTNTIVITSGTQKDYEANNSTGSPSGIYLSYNTGSARADAPQSLTYANSASSAKVRMNYDLGTFPGTNAVQTRRTDKHTNNNVTYEIKATLASFTARTTYYCNIFHNLDKATYMVNKIWYEQTTYNGWGNHTGGGFELPAGTYNIYLLGSQNCGPWAGSSTNTQTDSSDGGGYGDYMVFIEKTNPVSYNEEHEVPVYMVGRGMPGSDLANGDYTNTKISVAPYSSGSACYRYVPFYAEAGHSDTFPCYANLAARGGVTLKAGDRFVLTDGSAKKTTFTNSAGTDNIAVVSGEIVVKRSGTYSITAEKGADDSFGNAAFTIALSSSSDTRSGNDTTLQGYDQNPSAYSKQHGVRVFNASGSTINFGGSYDSSLFDSGEDYVSFVIELRHINTNRAGKLSASFANLPAGTKYRYVQTGQSTTSNVTAIDDNLTFPNAFTTRATATDAIFSNVDLGVNTAKNTDYDYCFSKATLIEVKIPFASLLASTTPYERVSYALSFSINISFQETLS